MELILFVFVTEFESVVITTGNIPVQSAEDTFVVIDQRLAAELGKQAVTEIQLGPRLVQDEATVLIYLRVLSPDTDMLCGKAQREVLSLLIHRKTGTVVDKACRSLSFATGI